VHIEHFSETEKERKNKRKVRFFGFMNKISEKQLAANRANALKSTGPISEAGKSIVRANATKHGLSASTPATVLTPGEDPNELLKFAARLRETLQPVGDMEGLLVERIASCAWRLRRIERVEEGLLAHGFLEKQAQHARQEMERQTGFSDVTAQVLGAAVNDSKYQQAAAEHSEVLDTQHAVTGAAALGFLQDAQTSNAFSKLSRYEAGLERSFYKALEELKKLQRHRRNVEVANGMRRRVR
jgi:hypothetical protein